MSQQLDLQDFLKKLKECPIIDVRSEGEFEKGHVPGAYSLPLLNNAERAEVGITYKRYGREKAIEKGFDLMGGKLGDYRRKARKITKLWKKKFWEEEKETLPPSPQEIGMYCWRGGLRSGIMAWTLGLIRFQPYLLKGGYKTFRRWTLETLQTKKNIIVLGGMTGSGKTEILQCLAGMGEQIIDLEKLANHRGGAYGALGQPLPPTYEQFENYLALEWSQMKDDRLVWIEDKGRFLGGIKIPDSIYESIMKATAVELMVPRSIRRQRFILKHQTFPIEQLMESTQKIKKRLGGNRLNEALEFLRNNDFEGWTEILFEYYDKTYNYSLSQRDVDSVYKLEIDGQRYLKDAYKLKGFVNSIIINPTDIKRRPEVKEAALLPSDI